MSSKTRAIEVNPEQIADSWFRPIPLGEPIPSSPHSVSCSLPTMADITAYEEKDPSICQRIKSGYPRFVNPSFTQELESSLLKKKQKSTLDETSIRLFSSQKMFDEFHLRLPSEMKKDFAYFTDQRLHWTEFPNTEEYRNLVQSFLQHTGSMIFSREAEDELILRGLREKRHPEKADTSSNALQKILSRLAVDYEAKVEDVFLSNCGMSAFFAAFSALREIQKKRERTIWIQLGWLYIDTIETLKKLTTSEDEYIYIENLLVLDNLRETISSLGNRVAAVVTEIPTNPLLLTPNLHELKEICSCSGAALVIDISLSSPANVRVMNFCDIQISSLTKYYGWSGDIIMGSGAFNSKSSFYPELKETLPALLQRPYERDLQRLAFLLDDFPFVLERINSNHFALSCFLESNPKIKRIHSSLMSSPVCRKNYEEVQRHKKSYGALISFELNIPPSQFYDKICVAKGPSFGTSMSLLCPFVYLAHYNLVKTKEGCSFLRKNGLDPNLMRFSCGVEPTDRLLQMFQDVLAH